MKAIHQFIRATLMVALLALVAQPVRAWIPPAYVLPPFLPIGDTNTIWNWAVAKTNWLPNQWGDTTLYYTTTNGQQASLQNNSPVAFNTYEEYAEWMSGMAMNLVGILTTNGTCSPTSNVLFVCSVHYLTTFTGFPETSFVGLMESKWFGPLPTLNSNAIWSVRPKYGEITVCVPRLSSLRIDVTTPTNNCWYVWSNSIPSSSPTWPRSPIEWTTNGFVDLNYWYSLAQYRSRFTIVAGGQTGVYTQHGAMIVPPTVAIRPGWLDVGMPRGCDVTIQCSADQKNWSVLTNLSWALATNFTSIPIDQSQPARFFRLFAR